MAIIRRRYALFSKMSFQHRQLASDVGYLDRLQVLESKVIENATVLNEVSKFAKEFYNVNDSEMKYAKPVSNIQIVELLHHLVRDWSKDETKDREQLFSPILDSLSTEFLKSSDTKGVNLNSNGDIPANAASHIRVLVPGSGLARLAFEISKLGFSTDALEYSRLMDIAANFIFNRELFFQANNVKRKSEKGKSGYQFEIFPYIHDFSHQVKGENQYRGELIPDIDSPLFQPPNLHLGYGDFTKLAKCETFPLPQYPNLLSVSPKGSDDSSISSSDSLHPIDSKLSFSSSGSSDSTTSSTAVPCPSPSLSSLRLTSNKSQNGNKNKRNYGRFLKSGGTTTEEKSIRKDNSNNFSKDLTESQNTLNTMTIGSGPNSYDAIVTLFLIDTAENAIEYLECIYKLLKPGGIWINYGPLKWGTSPQVELTMEELEMIITKLNFSIEKKFSGTNEYNGDPRSLWSGTYKISGWVARK